MKFTLAFATATMALLSTSVAWKCQCDDSMLTLNVCEELGHQHSSNSCGMKGCCLATSEIDSFRDACSLYGGRFKTCYDCASCN